MEKNKKEERVLAALVEEFDNLIEQAERLRELVIAEIGSRNDEEIEPERDSRRRLSTRHAAEILGIHPTNLTRIAQVNLIQHDRVVGRGGGRGGSYRFSGKEIAEAKPRIQELVKEARRLLYPEPDEYISTPGPPSRGSLSR